MSRTFADVADGARVMVDANIFVYALTAQTQLHGVCRTFLDRGAGGAIRLFTTVAVASEVIHRIMVFEVVSLGYAQRSADVVGVLKHQPQIVTQLTRYRTTCEICARPMSISCR